MIRNYIKLRNRVLSELLNLEIYNYDKYERKCVKIIFTVKNYT